MFERILVTGGTGFISSYVVPKLIAAGHRPILTYRGVTAPTNVGTDLYPLDITDTGQTNNLIRSIQPDAVIHLAGASSHDGAIGNEINFIATRHLLEVCEAVGVQRVILLGSAAEYGNQPTPFRENMPARPVSSYGISKANATAFALSRYAASGFPVTVLRVFTAYGFGQPAKMFLPQLVTHAILNRCFKMSDGLQRRDFVHVSDVADAVISTLTSSSAVGRIINIAGGRGIALRTVAEAVWDRCGADIKSLEIGALSSSGDDRLDTEADISVAAELLDWHPGAGILEHEAGLADMIFKMRNEIEQKT